MKFLLAGLLFIANTYAQDLFGLEDSTNHLISAIDLQLSQDPDIQTALDIEALDTNQVEATLVSFLDVNGVEWDLQVFQNINRPNGPTFFVPHDNENDAFLAGIEAISTYGGHLLSLECSENRLCNNGIDPNRYFLPDNPLYISTIMRFFEAKAYPVITLHNNHDSHWSLGGNGSIYADMQSPYTDGEGFYTAGDPDDLIIYTDTYEKDESEIFNFYQDLFSKNGINTIFEVARTEGSLGGHMST
ncbi:MAG: hypothetical protein KC478_01415, partial [Bacteriovoracaceae bacterium]|nr:hypothetical protein [Bacteriovoracaceae bacterium]